MILEWQVLGAVAAVIAALLVAALILLRLESRTPSLAATPHSSETDTLTGIRSRSSLDSLLRQNAPDGDAAALWLDLDHFKQINDSRGHDAGDQVLKEFAGVIASQVRSSDIAARYGGDEFVVLLPQGGSRGAASLASRIIEATRRHPFSCGRVSVSIGIAAANESATWESVLKNADQAMYRAKQAGRDRAER